MQEALDRSGHDVTVAASAEEALPTLARLHFDLVLVDIWLPGMSGLQLCRMIRGLADGQNTYIIIATSRQGETGVSDALKVGADDFLEKPCTPEMLAARIAVAERRIEVNHERRIAESERNAAVEALRSSERRYRQLFERNLAGVFRSTREGKFLDGNDAFLRIIAGDLKPDITEVFAPSLYVDETARDKIIAQVQIDGALINHEVELQTVDGRRIWALVNISFVKDDDSSDPVIEGTILDITEQKKAAEDRVRIETERLEAQKDRSLAILAGGVAHDFNNLLVGILGYTEMALDALPPDSRVAAYLKSIESASNRAATLTRQMLAYTGGGKYVVTQVDVTKLILDMDDLLMSAVGMRANVHFNLANDLPRVNVDISQLQQVLVNLVTNAAEAIESGKGDITIETGTSFFSADDHDIVVGNDLEDEQFVYFSIRDNGCGIEPEISGHIFEPFFSTKFQGRGLGLAASFGIVRAHGGAVTVDSHPGSGAKVTVWLPLSDH